MKAYKLPIWVVSLMVIATAGALVLTGCASTCGTCSRAKDTTGDMIHANMCYPTGLRSSSVICIEKIMPKMVRAGVPFDYQIKVCNVTDLEVKDVVVSEQMPEKFTLNKSVPEAQDAGTGLVKWNLGTLGPKQCKLITVTGTMATTGELPCCTDVKFNTNPLLCITPQAIAPALQLVSQGGGEILLCDPAVAKFTVSNTGSGVAKDVKLTVSLPEGLRTAEGKQGAVAYAVGALPAGESRAVSVRLQASKPGSYEVKSMATGDGNLTAEASAVAISVKQPVLKIETKAPSAVFAGRSGDFTVTVQNAGDAVAEQTVVQSRISSGMRAVSASDGGRASAGGATWNLGALQPGQSKTLTVKAQAVAGGPVQATAVAQAYCCSEASAQAATEVKGIPAILLEVVDVTDPVEVGGQETYVITVTNQGSATDTNIKVKASLESAFTFVSASGPTKGTTADNQTVEFAPLASLAPKQKATWQIIAKAVSAGQHLITVNLTSDQLERGVGETEATQTY